MQSVVILKQLKISLIILSSLFFYGANCKTPGDLKFYSIHPEQGMYRYNKDEIEWIYWDDPRLECRIIEEEIQCPYGAASWDDIGTIIDMAR